MIISEVFNIKFAFSHKLFLLFRDDRDLFCMVGFLHGEVFVYRFVDMDMGLTVCLFYRNHCSFRVSWDLWFISYLLLPHARFAFVGATKKTLVRLQMGL